MFRLGRCSTVLVRHKAAANSDAHKIHQKLKKRAAAAKSAKKGRIYGRSQEDDFERERVFTAAQREGDILETKADFDRNPEVTKLHPLTISMKPKPYEKLLKHLRIKNLKFDKPVIFTPDLHADDYRQLYIKLRQNRTRQNKSLENSWVANMSVYTPSPLPNTLAATRQPVILEEDEEESQFTSRNLGRTEKFIKTSEKEFVEGAMNFSDTVKTYLESKELTMNTNLSFDQWETDFKQRRSNLMSELQEMLPETNIPPYPAAGILEKLQQNHKFSTNAEFKELIMGISYFKIGELKQQIQEEWEIWIDQVTTILINFLKNAEDFQVHFDDKLPEEKIVILDFWPQTDESVQKGQTVIQENSLELKYLIDVDNFFSQTAVVEMMELAGRIEESYIYGLGELNRKNMKMLMYKDYEQARMRYSYVEGLKSIAGDVSFIKGRILCWYESEEAAKKAVEYFHGKKVKEFSEILDQETMAVAESTYTKKKRYMTKRIKEETIRCVTAKNCDSYTRGWLKMHFSDKGHDNLIRGSTPSYDVEDVDVVHEIVANTLVEKAAGSSPAGEEFSGFVNTNRLKARTETYRLRKIEKCVFLMQDIVSIAFARGQVAQNATRITFFTDKECRRVTNLISSRMITLLEEKLKELRLDGYEYEDKIHEVQKGVNPSRI